MQKIKIIEDDLSIARELKEMLASVSLTMLFLILIYGGYFLITYYCSKNIIRERKS